jgi:hypothetical protein
MTSDIDSLKQRAEDLLDPNTGGLSPKVREGIQRIVANRNTQGGTQTHNTAKQGAETRSGSALNYVKQLITSNDSKNFQRAGAYDSIGLIINLLQQPDIIKKLNLDKDNLLKGLQLLVNHVRGESFSEEDIYELFTLNPQRKAGLKVFTDVLDLEESSGENLVFDRLENMTSTFRGLRTNDQFHGYIEAIKKLLATLNEGGDIGKVGSFPDLDLSQKKKIFDEGAIEAMNQAEANRQNEPEPEPEVHQPEPEPEPEVEEGVDYQQFTAERQKEPSIMMLRTLYAAFNKYAQLKDVYFEGDTLQAVMKKIGQAGDLPQGLGHALLNAALMGESESDLVAAIAKTYDLETSDELEAKLNAIAQSIAEIFPDILDIPQPREADSQPAGQPTPETAPPTPPIDFDALYKEIASSPEAYQVYAINYLFAALKVSDEKYDKNYRRFFSEKDRETVKEDLVMRFGINNYNAIINAVENATTEEYKTAIQKKLAALMNIQDPSQAKDMIRDFYGVLVEIYPGLGPSK